MSDYFDCLSDQVPQTVIDRAHLACQRATHEGAGRPGEPVVMAGIRALIDGMITPEQYDVCVNKKRSVWKPRRNTPGQFNLSSAEARVVNDLMPVYAHTPDWQVGDQDVLRQVELTDAGKVLLAERNATCGEMP